MPKFSPRAGWSPDLPSPGSLPGPHLPVAHLGWDIPSCPQACSQEQGLRGQKEKEYWCEAFSTHSTPLCFLLHHPLLLHPPKDPFFQEGKLLEWGGGSR